MANKANIVIGEVRFSYLHVFNPQTAPGSNVAKYSVTLLIPKDSPMVDKIKIAIKAAVDAGVAEKFGGHKPATLKLPLRDGNAERPEHEEFQGCYFINASCKTRPGVVSVHKDINGRRIVLAEGDLKSGDYGYADISFFPFNTNGNKGIACGLNNLMLTREGEALGGRVSADTSFADINDTFEDDDII